MCDELRWTIVASEGFEGIHFVRKGNWKEWKAILYFIYSYRRTCYECFVLLQISNLYSKSLVVGKSGQTSTWILLWCDIMFKSRKLYLRKQALSLYCRYLIHVLRWRPSMKAWSTSCLRTDQLNANHEILVAHCVVNILEGRKLFLIQEHNQPSRWLDVALWIPISFPNTHLAGPMN